jgi:hypothetical protein
MARAHDDHAAAVGMAQAALDIGLKAAATEAARTALRVTYYRAILASGHAQGISTGAAEALRRLGADPGALGPTDT